MSYVKFMGLKVLSVEHLTSENLHFVKLGSAVKPIYVPVSRSTAIRLTKELDAAVKAPVSTAVKINPNQRGLVHAALDVFYFVDGEKEKADAIKMVLNTAGMTGAQFIEVIDFGVRDGLLSKSCADKIKYFTSISIGTEIHSQLSTMVRVKRYDTIMTVLGEVTKAWEAVDYNGQTIEERLADTGITIEQLSVDIETGIRNGYSVEDQLAAVRAALTKLSGGNQ